MFASSADFACSRASSGVMRTKAFSRGLKRSIRSRYARVSSVEETSRRRTAAAWSSADANGSMAVNGADSRGRVVRRGQLALERVGPCGRDGHEQAAARLSVTEHHLVDPGGAAPVHLVVIRLVVAPAPRWEEVA